MILQAARAKEVQRETDMTSTSTELAKLQQKLRSASQKVCCTRWHCQQWCSPHCYWGFLLVMCWCPDVHYISQHLGMFM